ncbi:hypothetical protein FHR71_001211 [Methylobacterium sp. RAS18]|nr:hypothetical protein [Methylobacterium sp. RAS18]
MSPFRTTWTPPAVLMRTGECLVPTELSWRRADHLVKSGFATINPHHQRWLGKLTLTASGRDRAGLSLTLTPEP